MYTFELKELKYLTIATLLLSVANIVDLLSSHPFWPITRLINLGSDQNLAAWFGNHPIN